MDSEAFNDNRDLWSMASNAWREMPCPVAKRKLVLLVPHPDGPIVGCSGLLQKWTGEASETLIIYVATGEASYGCQSADEQAGLARIRRNESKETLTSLQIGTPVRILELYLPDSKVESFEFQLEEQLRLELDSNSIVIAPYSKDGHADHSALGKCAQKLAEKIGFELHIYPLWVWFCTAPTTAQQASRLYQLSAAQSQLNCKAKANRYLESQIASSSNREAIIPEEYFLHDTSIPFEVLVH